MDILGKALMDFQSGNYSEDIITTSSLNEEDILPLPYLFRSFEEMPVLEQKALESCRGTVLDIGCGAGSHSMYLQKKGFDVTAMDQSQELLPFVKPEEFTRLFLQIFWIILKTDLAPYYY